VYVIYQLLLSLASLVLVTLRRTPLAKNAANSSFRISQPITENLYRLSATGWGYKFFADISIASFMISMSFHDLHVDPLIGDDLSEALVFFLEVFEFFDELRAHPPVFLPPAIVGPFADLDDSAGFFDGFYPCPVRRQPDAISGQSAAVCTWSFSSLLPTSMSSETLTKLGPVFWGQVSPNTRSQERAASRTELSGGRTCCGGPLSRIELQRCSSITTAARGLGRVRQVLLETMRKQDVASNLPRGQERSEDVPRSDETPVPGPSQS